MQMLRETKCSEPSCFKTTRDGKPYCSDHLDRMPYARRVMEEFAARRAEAESLRRGANVRPDSYYFDDIELLLRERGPCTIDRLAKEFSLPRRVMKKVVRSMARINLVRLGRTTRNIMTVELR